METSDRMQLSFSHNFEKDKLHSFWVIQDDQNTRLLGTTNYRIDHIIKRFHDETSKISELFSQENLPLFGMQGNNALLAKPFNKFPKSPIRPAGSHF